MASLYDLLNLQTASVMRDPLAPLSESARIRQQEERADARSRSLLETQLQFQERSQQNRIRFDTEQGKLDREARAAQAEATAKATLDRMSELDKQKIREKLILETGLKPDKGEEIDDFIIRASGEKDKRAVNVLKAFDADEKKIQGDIKALETSELNRQDKLRRSLTSSMLEGGGYATQKEWESIQKVLKKERGVTYRFAIENAAIEPKRKAAILSGLASIESSVEVEATKVPSSYLQAADDLRGRLTNLDRSRATYSATADGQRALAKYYEENPQAAIETAAKDAPIDTSLTASADEFTPQPEAPAALAPNAAAAPAAAQPTSNGLTPNFSAIANAVKGATVGSTPDGRTTFMGIPMSSAAGRSMDLAPVIRSGVAAMRRTAIGAPGLEATAARIWGEDAPALLTEAGKLSDSNGIPKEQQQATLNAALAGDTAAQEQISTVLNYLRQAKQSQGQSFQPAFDPGSLFPTNSFERRVEDYGPIFAPAR
jgi:hypothetical protein